MRSSRAHQKVLDGDEPEVVGDDLGNDCVDTHAKLAAKADNQMFDGCSRGHG